MSTANKHSQKYIYEPNDIIIDECITNIYNITDIKFNIDDVNEFILTKLLHDFINSLQELDIKEIDIKTISYYINVSEYDSIEEHMKNIKPNYNKHLLSFISNFIELSRWSISLLKYFTDSLPDEIYCHLRIIINIQNSVIKNILEHKFVTNYDFIAWEFHLYASTIELVCKNINEKSFTKSE